LFRRETLKAPSTRLEGGKFKQGGIKMKKWTSQIAVGVFALVVFANNSISYAQGYWPAQRVAKIVITPIEMQEFLYYEFGVVENFGNPISSDSAYTWAICVPPRSALSEEDILSGGKHPLPVYERHYLDNFHHEGRDRRDSTYTVFCRPNLNADEDMKNFSYNNIQEKKIMILTACECLLVYRFLYNKYGFRLDHSLTSSLTDSHHSRGGVKTLLILHWYDAGVGVDKILPDYAFEYLCARRAVSAVFSK
jgi:hypothetical protein